MLCHITMLLLYIQNGCQARALSHFALFTVTLNHQKERRRKKNTEKEIQANREVETVLM